MTLIERVEADISSAWLCSGCDQISEHLPITRSVVCCPGRHVEPLTAAALRARATQENG